MKPWELAELQRSVVQILATTKGEFDAEIKTLTDARKEWDERNDLAAVKAENDSAKADIEAAKASVEKQAQEHQDRLTALQNTLAARESAVMAREKEAAALLLDLQNRIDASAAAREAEKATADALAENLAHRIADAEIILADLDQRNQVITQREARVKAVAAAMVN